MSIKKSRIHTTYPIFKLGDLISDMYRYPTFYGMEYLSHGVKVLKGENITREGEWQKLDDVRCISEQTNVAFSRTVLRENDLVMTVRGEVGKVALVNALTAGNNITANLIKISLKESIEKIGIYPCYVWLYLNSDIGKALIKQKTAGAVQETITVAGICDIDVILPSYETQVSIARVLQENFCDKKSYLQQATDILSNAKKHFFKFIGISLEEYTPSLYSFSNRGKLREMGIYCNPHSSYLNTMFENLRKNEYYAGDLEDFVEINPATSREGLQESTLVSFVPMPAVEEKTNVVTYEAKPYKEVKNGFTIFQKGDLLWAKITPCMQNGKSFLADRMPTDIGFGSTEFHVLRKKSERVYMPYLWVILSDSHILEAAQGMFSGSAGQQRVPDTFLKKFPIVLPPVEVQKELADTVFNALQQADKMRKEAENVVLTAKEQFEKELLK